MTARLVRCEAKVLDSGEIHLVEIWSDNTRTSAWLGFWATVRLMWRYMRNGVPVEVIE
jgi:hypothetical protein